MSGWPEFPIGDVVRIIGGGTPTRTNPEYYGGSIPWVTPKDMKSWNITGAQISITQRGLDSSAARLAPTGSVLIVVRSGVLKHTLPVGINHVPVAINQDMKALICSASIDPSYLAYFLKAKSNSILKWVRATTADNFPIDKLRDLPIPLPPVAIQKQIAKTLDHSEKLRQLRRRELSLIDTLIQSVFINMFGDPIHNDRGWLRAKVANFVKTFESGKSFSADENERSDTRFRILKISAVTSGKFLPDESKPVRPEYIPPESHFVHDGDLLFSRANTAELIGATALVSHAPDNLLLPDKLWRFVWQAPQNVHPLFVRQLFRQKTFRHEISTLSTGSSGSMKNISQEKVLSIECGLPPLALQRSFAAKVTALEELKQSHLAHLARLDELFASLQYRAFRGVG